MLSANLVLRKNVVSTFLLVLGYGLVLYFIQFFMSRIGLSGVVPGSETLARWDAAIYHDVSVVGYTKERVGIYVLLPTIWHILHASYMGMAIANMIFFSIGFALLTDIFPVSVTEKILWLSTPSLYFMFVPYTEALFCLLSAMTFYGIVKKNKWLTWISLFLIALNRATAIFLIPALLIMELLTNDKKNIGRTLINYLINYALPTVAGTFTFILIQYYQTGIWFAYFKQQATALGHQWNLPILPFSNYFGGTRITWLNALAIVPCFVALGLLLAKGYNWLFRNQKQTDKVWILTLCYLPIILAIMIFCNPIWGSGTTNLLGLHRYVFCSPFIFVLFYNLINKAGNYKWYHFMTMFFVCNLVWLTMGSYLHIVVFLFYNFNTLIVLGYMLHANKKTEWVTLALVALNVFFQASLFQQYLTGLFTD